MEQKQTLQRQPLFRNQMQQMRFSLSLSLSLPLSLSLCLCHKLQERDYRGVLTLSNSLIKRQTDSRRNSGDYSCPPSPSPSRSECHEFHNSSPGHDNRGGGGEGRIREEVGVAQDKKRETDREIEEKKGGVCEMGNKVWMYI